MMQSHRQSEFWANMIITNPTPARRVTPPWNVYMAKCDPGWEGYPVWPGYPPWWVTPPIMYPRFQRIFFSYRYWWFVYFLLGILRTDLWSQGTHHVNVIKLKWEIIWTYGLPHLPGVPHLHVKQALNLLLFCLFRCRSRRRCLSSLLLWSRNFATMVTWGHTSPLYGEGCALIMELRVCINYRITRWIHPFSVYFPCTSV